MEDAKQEAINQVRSSLEILAEMWDQMAQENQMDTETPFMRAVRDGQMRGKILRSSDPAKSIKHVNKSKGPDITNLVKRDLEARARTGAKKYGTRLKPFNGRNPIVDAYQEALDLACYLRQEIEEEKIKQPKPNES